MIQKSEIEHMQHLNSVQQNQVNSHYAPFILPFSTHNIK